MVITSCPVGPDPANWGREMRVQVLHNPLVLVHDCTSFSCGVKKLIRWKDANVIPSELRAYSEAVSHPIDIIRWPCPWEDTGSTPVRLLTSRCMTFVLTIRSKSSWWNGFTSQCCIQRLLTLLGKMLVQVPLSLLVQVSLCLFCCKLSILCNMLFLCCFKVQNLLERFWTWHLRGEQKKSTVLSY